MINRDTLILYAFGTLLLGSTLLWLGVFNYKEVRRMNGIVEHCVRQCDKPVKATVINIRGDNYAYDCVCGGSVAVKKER